MNWRAEGERLSRYCRCPSAKRVSKARLLFPEPLGPVMTTSLPRGISRLMFWRLCVRAPRIRRVSAGAAECASGGVADASNCRDSVGSAVDMQADFSQSETWYCTHLGPLGSAGAK